ncbi:hypothetical protein Mx9_p51 [Myxococcus phage Mx9]|nr:hypothetical protein Mx9_p51 [Myxococcus phage Mx9]
MNCKKHGEQCANFDRWMAAEAKSNRLRVEADAAKGKVERLTSRLARVGARDTEGYQPPDTRRACWVATEWGQCGQPAQESGICSAHEADEAGI